jgi:LuxR family transcriptional regulator, maltose regulon positive regulatory protein
MPAGAGVMSGNTGEALIVEGKLYPATGTRDPLPRPRLDSACDVLDGAYTVVLVDAPAGYGKSTLMAQWYARLTNRHIACAWLSLDEDDNDKTRFLRHLVAALRTADAQVGRVLAANLSADFSGDTKPQIEALAAHLSTVQGRIVLFLDDLHFVQDAESIQIVDWLANYAPRNCQFVIGTRDKHGLRLSGLRVRRQLLEIDLRQLQFDSTEAAQFCRNRLGHDLSMGDLQRLLVKTEGWPAALELATLALTGLVDPGRFIEGFAGTHSTLVEYLGEAVLSRMDEQTRNAVFQIAMFDRVCAALAQALGGIDDAEKTIQALRVRNLFLIPLDEGGTWFRFHHLVGDFFRERYRRTAPVQAKECLVRGARWMLANGHIEDAVNCMIRAQEWEQATRWVAESLEELVFRRGQHQTILRWMNALPEVWVDRYPVIRIQYAFALAFYARYQKYEAQIHALQQLLQRLEDQPQRDDTKINELRCAVELLTAMSAGLRDEGTLGGELAAEWLARWPQESMRRKGVMGNVLAFGYKTAGAIDRGLEVIYETRRWLQQDEGYYALSWNAYLEAVLHMKRGGYLEARRACALGLELVERELQGHRAQASMLHALLAGIAYEFDEIDVAIRHVEQAMSSVNECSHADAVMVAYLTQARLQRLRRDEHGAGAILREGQELAERQGLRRVSLSLAAEECSGLVRAGCYAEARLVAARFGFQELRAASGASDLIQDKALRAASRYLLLQSPTLVIDALDPAIESCRRRELAHRSVELLLIRALAHQQATDWARAESDFIEALAIAGPRGYWRVILDEARALDRLIGRLDLERLRDSQAAPLARRLQQQTMSRSEPPLPQTSMAASQQLTRREVSILKRLETGLSNKEIAEAIFVSEGTLKWHLHNVYGKLEVKNRSGAISRAKDLGIL